MKGKEDITNQEKEDNFKRKKIEMKGKKIRLKGKKIKLKRKKKNTIIFRCILSLFHHPKS